MGTLTLARDDGSQVQLGEGAGALVITFRRVSVSPGTSKCGPVTGDRGLIVLECATVPPVSFSLRIGQTITVNGVAIQFADITACRPRMRFTAADHIPINRVEVLKRVAELGARAHSLPGRPGGQGASLRSALDDAAKPNPPVPNPMESAYDRSS